MTAGEPDVGQLVEKLLSGVNPEQHQALVDALMSARVATMLDSIERPEDPTLRSAPDEVRGFRVRLDLHGAKPPVWRRLELPGDLTMPRLHDVIQAAMGWQDSHLHRFRTARDHRSPYFITRFDVEEGEEGVLEDDVRLDQVLAAEGDEIWYEYDFGDGWDHRLLVEEVFADPPATVRCTAGRMACPPEDCGGIGGYEELAAWVRSGHDDHSMPQGFEDGAHARAWLPLDWHPDDFDVEEVNVALSTALAEPVVVTDEVADIARELERRGIRTLRGILARPLSHGVTEVDDADAARLTETYRTFLDVIGDGVKLTGAGHLPPTVVEEVAARTGISDWWSGKATREDLTRPVADIRRTARGLGLVSVRKGRLAPTATATRCAGDPQALLRHIVARLPLGRNDGERQSGWIALACVGGGTPLADCSDEITDMMYDLGWRSGHDRNSPPRAASDTLDVLRLLGGGARVRWYRVTGVDHGLAAVARAAVRIP